MDIAIRNGVIAEIAPQLSPIEGVQEEDVSGCCLCPGLVDLHGHWYEGSAFGIDPDLCLNHGVCTVVDAGTSGFINYADFRRRNRSARIGVLTFLNIAGAGIPSPLSGELQDLRLARIDDAVETIASDIDQIVGVKVRLGNMMSGNNGIEPLCRALDAASRCSLPVMVHVSTGAPTREVLRRLRPGDILTHCFQGRGDGILLDGVLLPEVGHARANGVVFDVGHGCGSFCWNTARRAFEHHFYPDTISTDLHRYSIERFAGDLPTTMSKFLHLGMPLGDVVAKTTSAPAAVLGRQDQIGSLRPGRAADLFAFSLEEGEFPFQDTHLRTEIARIRIAPRFAIRKGNLIRAGEQPYSLRKFHPSDAEIFHHIEQSA
jgi:dihydroorotase